MFLRTMALCKCQYGSWIICPSLDIYIFIFRSEIHFQFTICQYIFVFSWIITNLSNTFWFKTDWRIIVCLMLLNQPVSTPFFTLYWRYDLSNFMKVPETQVSVLRQYEYKSMHVTVNIIHHGKYEVHQTELSVLQIFSELHYPFTSMKMHWNGWEHKYHIHKRE